MFIYFARISNLQRTIINFRPIEEQIIKVHLLMNIGFSKNFIKNFGKKI